jgi:MFS family permease
MSLKSKMPLQIWILTLSAFAIGTAEFVIAGVLPQVAGSLGITEGQAGNLITAYALAIVVGGPILTLWLARFEKRKVLLGLMALFIAGNLIGALTANYTLLLVSRVIAGLTQGPFYGIGAIVATKLVSDKLAGQAVGQMFAGLTLANVLGVPAGTWIGNALGIHAARRDIDRHGILRVIDPVDASVVVRRGDRRDRRLSRIDCAFEVVATALKDSEILLILPILPLPNPPCVAFRGRPPRLLPIARSTRANGRLAVPSGRAYGATTSARFRGFAARRPVRDGGRVPLHHLG